VAEPTRSSSEARAILLEALVATGAEDRSAFNELYNLTSAKLFGICIRICRDRQVAEDVLHEVYLTIWKRAGAYEPGRGSPMTWLATIARNRSIDWIRSTRSRKTVPITAASEVPDLAPSAVDLLLSGEDSARLHTCLQSLVKEQRAAIRNAFFDGLTYAQLAEAQAVPLATMKSRIRRGLLQLKDCLQQ
jgi:RNA polymerase sigma factor (sigma-70 family)